MAQAICGSMAAMTVHLDTSPLALAAPLGGGARQASLREALPTASATPIRPSDTPVLGAGALVSISAQGRQSLGEATMTQQNQNTLLQALDHPVYSSGVRPTPTPTAVVVPVPLTAPLPTVQGEAALPAATPLPMSAPVGTTPSPDIAPMLGNSRNDGPMAMANSPQSVGHFLGQAAANRAVTAGATAAASTAQWPTRGVGKPLQHLAQALLQQATAPAVALRVLAAQHWPATLIRVVDPESATDAEHGLEPLHPWIEGQGVVQTPDGPRGVSISLRVSLAWLRALAQAETAKSGEGWVAAARTTLAPTASNTVPRPLQAAFLGPAASLQSGTLALALESPALPGVRTSALLLLEFQPLLRSAAGTQAQALYGHPIAPHLRQDPWLQMTSLQVSGHVRHEEEEAIHANAALCDTPGCPYQGETACVQPFCMVLRTPAPVDALASLGGKSRGSAQGLSDQAGTACGACQSLSL